MDATEMRKQIEQQYPGLPFHEAVATLILGQWPRVSIHDPATYIKSMARVLAQHGDAAALAGADPATGIASQIDKLPTMKQLGDWLSNKATTLATAIQYAAMPKVAPPSRRIVGPPPKLKPNQFVPEGFPGYDKMFAKHKETGGEFSFTERRECLDKETRFGVWIPSSWWDNDSVPIKTWARPPAKEIIDGLGF